MRIFKIGIHIPILIILMISLFQAQALCENAKVVKTSSPSMPDWILKKKKSADFVYFTGMSSRSPDIKAAKKEAVDDAASQLVEYIGFRATARFKSTKEMSDSDNVSSVKENIEQTLEGKGTASVNIDIEDFYYEQYSDGTINMYCLLKFPVDWVEKERKRLAKLVADQRMKSQEYMGEADESLKAGALSKSLDLAVQALFISEKAAENSDLYDQSKNMILLILSSLSFTLEGSPKYAYKEGGSDPIIIRAASTKTTESVPGLLVEVNEANTNAVMASKTGNSTDAKSEVEFNVSKIVNPDIDKLDIYSTFSLAKLAGVGKFDEDFYKELSNLQGTQALKFSLTAAGRDKAITTALVVFDMIKQGKQNFKGELSPKLQETVSGKMADAGYNIISAEIPESVVSAARDEGRIKQAMIAYIKTNYSGVKRVLIGMRQINYLGEIGKDIVFKDYDLNDSNFKSAEVKLILSFINIDSGKTEKGVTIDSRGMGLNIGQAVDNATKKITDKLDGEISKF